MESIRKTSAAGVLSGEARSAYYTPNNTVISTDASRKLDPNMGM